MNPKQIIVIRRDLKMRRGKEIAQGSHASIAFATNRIRTGEKFTKVQMEWIADRFTKVCCQVPDLDGLMKVYEDAVKAGLEVHLIEDSGRTEFNDKPTITCLAIGPHYADDLQPVTGELKLY